MRYPWSVPVLLDRCRPRGLRRRSTPGGGTVATAAILHRRDCRLQVGRQWEPRVSDCRDQRHVRPCKPPSERQGPIIGRPEPPEEWINVAVVERVTTPREQR